MPDGAAAAVTTRLRSQLRPGRRLFATVSLLTAVLLGVGGGLAWRTYVQERSREKAEIRAVAESAAAIADRFLGARLDQLDAIASTDAVVRGDRRRMHAYFSSLEPRQGVFTGGIGFVDTTGTLRVSSARAPGSGAVDLSDRDYVRWTLDNREPYIGAAELGRSRRDAVLPLAVPARDEEGRLSGLVVAYVRLLEAFNEDLEALRALAEQLIVIDRGGQVIVDTAGGGPLGPSRNPDVVERFRLEVSGFSEVPRGPRNRPDRAIGFATAPAGGWLVLVNRASGVVFAPARDRLFLTLGLLGLVGAVAVASGFWLGRQLDRASRQREERRWYERRLERAVASLSAATTAEAVTDAAVSSTVEVLEPSAAGVATRPLGGRPPVVASPASAPDMPGTARVGDRAAVQRALELGEPVWDEPGRGGGAEEVTFALPVADDTVLAMVLPPGRTLTEPERSFLTALADRTRGALARARLHTDVQAAESTLRDQKRLLESALGRERESSRAIQLLLAVTAGLVEAATPDAIADVLAGETRKALEADTVLVFLASENADGLRLVRGEGFPAGLIERMRRIPADATLPSAAVRRSRRRVVLESFEEALGQFPDLEPFRGTWSSALYVPVLGEQEVLAVIAWGFRTPRSFEPDVVRLAEAIADQAALALDRARLFEIEHRTAVVLQRSLLPARLPHATGADFAARYQAGAEDLEVGGDWYDVLDLPTGRIGLVLGDVVGRGLRAAAAMGQLRSAVGALAQVTPGPGSLLEELESFAARTDGAEFATVAFAVLDPVTGLLRYACAAHPPPLVVGADGVARYLEDGRSTPLCGIGGESRREAALRLPPGATVILYSDGLVERRGESLDDGLERLRRAAERNAGLGLAALGDALLEGMTGEERIDDDVALLLARRSAVPANALALCLPARPDQVPLIRNELRLWLDRAGVPVSMRDDLLLAAGEAVGNAVEHAYATDGAGTGSVELVAWTADGDSVLRLEVSDQGRWRGPGGDPDRGRGLTIMRALLDSVHVVQTPDGTSISMSKNLS